MSLRSLPWGTSPNAALVGRPVGEALRGKALSTVVSVEAADNYRVVFALAEVDSGFTNKAIFLADSKAGQPLDALEGPLDCARREASGVLGQAGCADSADRRQMTPVRPLP